MVHKFTLLKGINGIAIFLDIDELVNAELGTGCIYLSEQIYIKLEDEIIFLSIEELDKYIKPAISELSMEILRKRPNMKICLHIKSVVTNPIYFQEEGLYYAMLGWLSVYYNIELPSIVSWYNKEKRKFEFEPIRKF
ncbi:hypothetical protein DVR12_26980 [Chitinophaga silvatica]|uniref:Uncharacterized protein n=1 Tax=Chitinophaga silvatica TaxID=2282649 RepID=A0A3E1Y1Y7_9BACT|nr:hypothetical protein [Chitinophaga silvatica]RFS18692.1 hypothetical protein DVR12_26980 [Chitinophaga silvatica]